MGSRPDNSKRACDVCNVELSNLVQVRCAECEECDLCVPCFAKGATAGDHKPWHKYRIIEQYAFPIFERGWGADEELQLIEGAEQFGIGSWQDIAEHIGGRTSDEVYDHYRRVYLDVETRPLPDMTLKFDVDKLQFNEERRERIEQYRRDLASQPPMKPNVLVSAPACHEVQGYMPGRLEFDIEAENEAEMPVKDMIFEPEDTELDVEHKLTVLEIYNSRLTRRAERKRTILAHGLLDYRKLQLQEKKRTKEDRELHNKLKPYVRVLPPGEFDQFCEDMLAEQQLRRRIAELQEYRQAGIRSFAAATKYERDKQIRMAAFGRNQSAAQPAPQQQQTQPAGPVPNTRSIQDEPHRYKKPNLGFDVASAPDADLLSPQERALCAQLRLLPRAYMVLKEMVFEELLQRGGRLRKKELRTSMDSIEEQKIGRVYDFFQSQNWIS